MLGSAQADTLSAKRHCLLRHIWRIGIGANFHGAVLVGPLHDGLEQLVGVALLRAQGAVQHALHLGIGALYHAFVDCACAAIYGDVISLFQHDLARR